jgi:hypothetical protein
LPSSFEQEYDASDAEGYITPEFYEHIASTYGTNSSTDVVMKPVYFSIDNSIPTAIKYSIKVLTDDICANFPHLNSYREQMRKVGADQMVFKSAVKVGLPKQTSALEPSTGMLKVVNPESLITINNSFLRFQLNPAKEVDVTVKNPSQLTAQMNTNGQNPSEIFDLHLTNAALIANGRRQLQRDLRITRKGTLSKAALDKVLKRLASTVEELPGASDLKRLLSFRNPITKQPISLSLPLIAEKTVSTISSMYSASTVGFSLSGSKLVLQADLGPTRVWDVRTNSYQVRDLQYKDHEGYTEVILPIEYQEFLNVGDTFHPSSNGIVGFRIPSTNYHSGIAARVVGFYPASANSKSNIIIAPSLIVYYHGSDYDVDGLFIIKKQR